jgi:hypothetical protein
MNTPPPIPSSPDHFEPMPEPPTPSSIIATLLKYPARIIHELRHERGRVVIFHLILLGLAGIAVYGIVVGSLTGGTQMLVAPAKLVLGTIAATLICLPSLYIFISLSGIDMPIRTVAGALFAAVCLSALLLIGFAPVAWIFSQSTDSVALMGALHLLFWIIGIGFGLRLIRAMCRFAGGRENGHLRIWTIIFLLVCFQMTATLRPVIARSTTFFPTGKKFFLSHWFDTMTATSSSTTNRQNRD